MTRNVYTGKVRFRHLLEVPLEYFLPFTPTVSI
jgi:hypothetical protein